MKIDSLHSNKITIVKSLISTLVSSTAKIHHLRDKTMYIKTIITFCFYMLLRLGDANGYLRGIDYHSKKFNNESRNVKLEDGNFSEVAFNLFLSQERVQIGWLEIFLTENGNINFHYKFQSDWVPIDAYLWFGTELSSLPNDKHGVPDLKLYPYKPYKPEIFESKGTQFIISEPLLNELHIPSSDARNIEMLFSNYIVVMNIMDGRFDKVSIEEEMFVDLFSWGTFQNVKVDYSKRSVIRSDFTCSESHTKDTTLSLYSRDGIHLPIFMPTLISEEIVGHVTLTPQETDIKLEYILDNGYSATEFAWHITPNHTKPIMMSEYHAGYKYGTFVSNDEALYSNFDYLNGVSEVDEVDVYISFTLCK